MKTDEYWHDLTARMTQDERDAIISRLLGPDAVLAEKERRKREQQRASVWLAPYPTKYEQPSRDNESRELPSPKKKVNVSLTTALREMVFGQDAAVERITPYVEIFNSRLNPEGRPAGIFLLLGNTGSGKTYLVESLAEVIHGSHKNVIRVDCGEFQHSHEVAKLIGSPPGYLGHRETAPIFSQTKLKAIASERSNLSIVLFDEIEKASDAVAQLLLGVMDKGILRLGDNSAVNFENCLLFFTSNCGAQEMSRAARDGFSFARRPVDPAKMQAVAIGELKRKYSPEFLNRLDETIVFNPLTLEAGRKIALAELDKLEEFILRKRADAFAGLEYGDDTVEYLAELCLDVNYGARQAKRAVQRDLMRRIVPIFGELADGEKVKVLVSRGAEGLEIETRRRKEVKEVAA